MACMIGESWVRYKWFVTVTGFGGIWGESGRDDRI